jgi:hypothetical protein
MPRYIGYKPIGTANTSVTRLGGPSIIVDRKYNSGIWSLSDSYDRRLENIWPTTTRNEIPFTASYLVIAGGGGGGASGSGVGGGGAGAGVIELQLDLAVVVQVLKVI